VEEEEDGKKQPSQIKSSNTTKHPQPSHYHPLPVRYLSCSLLLSPALSCSLTLDIACGQWMLLIKSTTSLSIACAIALGSILLRLHEYTLLLVPPRSARWFGQPRVYRVLALECVALLALLLILLHPILSNALVGEVSTGSTVVSAALPTLPIDSITASALLMFAFFKFALTANMLFDRRSVAAAKLASRTSRTDSTVEELALVWIYRNPTHSIDALNRASASGACRTPTPHHHAIPAIRTLHQASPQARSGPPEPSALPPRNRERTSVLQTRLIVFDCIELLVFAAIVRQLLGA
jgi:hypothetical protein